MRLTLDALCVCSGWGRYDLVTERHGVQYNPYLEGRKKYFNSWSMAFCVFILIVSMPVTKSPAHIQSGYF